MVIEDLGNLVGCPSSPSRGLDAEAQRFGDQVCERVATHITRKSAHGFAIAFASVLLRSMMASTCSSRASQSTFKLLSRGGMSFSS